jgi:peptidoglycan/LPS O-acetylase OafA/YrhL
MLVIVSARGWTPRRTLILCAGIALTVAISRSVIFYLYGTATIFQTQSQMDALMLGVMLAMLLNFWPATFAAIQARWGWLVLLFCFALTWVMNERLFPFYYLETVAVDLGCAAILLLLFRPITCPDRNWFYRLVALIGTYSYSIYLWHLASGLAAERLVAKLPVVLQTLGWPVLWAAPYVAAFLAGVISAKLVEFPFLKLRERWVPSPKGTHLLSDSAPASAVQ